MTALAHAEPRKAMLRRATEADEAEILELLADMHAENGLAPMNEAKVVAKVRELLQTGVVLIAFEDDQPIATVGLDVRELWYSDAKFVGDWWFFVAEQARGGKTACELLQAARDAAKHVELPLVMGPTTLVRPEAKNRFFRKAGMIPLGGLFIVGNYHG